MLLILNDHIFVLFIYIIELVRGLGLKDNQIWTLALSSHWTFHISYDRVLNKHLLSRYLIGVILTIRRCLTDKPNILRLGAAHSPATWTAILGDILTTIRDITLFVLGILAGRKEEDGEVVAAADDNNLAPSFTRMGEAIDGLIDALAQVQLSEEDKKEEEEKKKLALSDEHQVVLACCWLNLKVQQA